MGKSILPAILLLIIVTQLCFAQDRVSKIDRIVTAGIDSGDLNGVVLVAEKGEIIYTRANGLANIEWDIPNTIDTRFRIYSMSKQFTSLLVMKLVEAGRIDLQKPISEYLPWYRSDVGSKVTVHHLLTHTHGIMEGYDRLPLFLVPDPTKQLVEKYFSNPIDFEPGSDFRYSGLLGYIVLGAILEAVTGQPYRMLLQNNILDPLGMNQSTYLDYHRLIPQRASDYFVTERGVEHRIQAYPLNADGASCLVSTVKDLLIWDQALYGEKLLSTKYRDLLFTPHVTKFKPYYYGFGWYVADIEMNGKIKRIHYHTGGGTSIIFRSVTDQRTVIMLNNFRSNNLYQIGLALLEQIGKN